MKAILFISGMMAMGCATRMETSTWVSAEAGKPVKRTIVEHTWWLGLPAFAPGDFKLSDGDFKVESKAVDLPDFNLSGWFEEDR